MSFAVHCNDAREKEYQGKCRLLSADLQPQYRPTFDKWLNTLPSPEATAAVTERLSERKTWWWATWLTSSLQAAQAGWALRLGVAGSFAVWTGLHSLLFLCEGERQGVGEDTKKQKQKKEEKGCQWRHLTTGWMQELFTWLAAVNVCIKCFTNQAYNVGKQISGTKLADKVKAISQAICQWKPRGLGFKDCNTLHTS